MRINAKSRSLLFCYRHPVYASQRSYVANSWIVTDYDENKGADDEKISFATNIRMMLSISGQVLNNTGAWTILDQHIWKDTYLRNGTYMAVGLLVMAATECMLSNAGVDDFAEEEGEEEEKEPSVGYEELGEGSSLLLN